MAFDAESVNQTHDVVPMAFRYQTMFANPSKRLTYIEIQIINTAMQRGESCYYANINWRCDIHRSVCVKHRYLGTGSCYQFHNQYSVEPCRRPTTSFLIIPNFLSISEITKREYMFCMFCNFIIATCGNNANSAFIRPFWKFHNPAVCLQRRLQSQTYPTV